MINGHAAAGDRHVRELCADALAASAAIDGEHRMIVAYYDGVLAQYLAERSPVWVRHIRRKD